MPRKNSSPLRGFMLVILIMNLAVSISFAQKIPRPEEILGFIPGADFHLATYSQALEYFRALEKASPMIKIFEAGKTEMGKSQIYAVITAVENMQKLDHYKEIQKKLSLAKGLTDEEAKRLAEEGRAIVYIDVGLHASECAPTQHSFELAYDLLTSEESSIKFTLENTILVLLFANPDGMDMLAEWYHPNVGTPYEVSPMPWLYNKYIGHDNNRDSYMLNMQETRNITRLLNKEWYPVILYNHHQTGPFPTRIWVPPTSEPTNPNVHPLLVRGKNLVGAGMAEAFEREGKPGVVSRIRYDTWYPGYVTEVVDSHNIISILTETNLYRYATPRFYTLSDFPEEYRDFTPSMFYPNPWKGGWWRLRDAVEYCVTSSKAVLNTAAKYREEFLYNKYQMGRDVISRFETEAPYAWIIPVEQRDTPTASVLLNKLMMLGIEVYKAEKPFDCDGISYPQGTWVIPMNQPFSLFVKTLFEEQNYPDLLKYPSAWEGLVRPQKFPDAYLPPYDMPGWTLPYQMGVKVNMAHSPLEANLTPLNEVKPPAGKVSKAGYAYLLSPTVNNSFIAVNRILEKGGEVLLAKEPLKVGGKSYPPGARVVLSKGISRSFMDSLAKELSLDIGGTGNRVGSTLKLNKLKVALYKSWVANMDEGWTRWLLEHFEFPVKSIHDAEKKAGKLKERMDVLVFAAQGTDSIVQGHSLGTMPPQYVGGIGEQGVKNIKSFVQEGGTVVALNSACLFAIEKLGLPAKDVLQGLRARGRREAQEDSGPPQFACPGSVLRMDFDPQHPVAYGMEEEAPAMFIRSPAFDVSPSFAGDKAPKIIAKYPGGNLLMSGYLRGGKHIQNKASVVEIPLGKGKVILLGFGVQQRGQPHGTFKVLFNSIYYGCSQ